MCLTFNLLVVFQCLSTLVFAATSSVQSPHFGHQISVRERGLSHDLMQRGMRIGLPPPPPPSPPTELTLPFKIFGQRPWPDRETDLKIKRARNHDLKIPLYLVDWPTLYRTDLVYALRPDQIAAFRSSHPKILGEATHEGMHYHLVSR